MDTMTTKPRGTNGFYIGAAVSLLVSANTSWRYFGDILHITDTAERVVMFSVLEITLIASGWAMRAGIRRSGNPGPAQLYAWGLSGAAAYMAISESGLADGLARTILGPLLGITSLHLALGIEKKASGHAKTGVLADVARELKERGLGFLGLGNDERDAVTRTKDRAVLRVAKLSLATGWVPFRTTRIRKALSKAGVAHDPNRAQNLINELKVLKGVGELNTLDLGSPWSQYVRPAATDAPVVQAVSAEHVPNVQAASAPAETKPVKTARRSANTRERSTPATTDQGKPVASVPAKRPSRASFIRERVAAGAGLAVIQADVQRTFGAGVPEASVASQYRRAVRQATANTQSGAYL